MAFSLISDGLYATSPILVAAFEDLLGAIVPLIFVIIWIVSQVMAASRGAKNNGPKKTLHPTPDKDLESADEQELVTEIQDFLRRVQGQGQATDRQESPPQVVEAEVIDLAEVDRDAEKPFHSKATPEKKKEHRLAAATTLQERSVRDIVQSAEQKPEQDLYAAYDHEVDNLSKTPQDTEKINLSEKQFSDVEEMPGDEQSEVEIPTTAEEIRDLLSQPEGIRKAVILREVFSRPVDRW